MYLIVFYLPYSLITLEVKKKFLRRLWVEHEFEWVILRVKLQMSFQGLKPRKSKENLRFKSFSGGLQQTPPPPPRMQLFFNRKTVTCILMGESYVKNPGHQDFFFLEENPVYRDFFFFMEQNLGYHDFFFFGRKSWVLGFTEKFFRALRARPMKILYRVLLAS